MTEATVMSRVDLEALVTRVLMANNVSEPNARSVSCALADAEIDGQAGHGLSRVASYAAQAKIGKVKGAARPTAERARAGLVRVDAGHGFAFPALDLAVARLSEITPETGIGLAVLRRSHHFGQAGRPCEQLAERGFAAMIFGNSPKAMAPWGAKTALLGTNPIGFAAPRHAGPPLVIDLALSRQARGKVLAAQKAGKSIPEGWALDENGAPTTNPAAALKGAMIPIGEAKGAALALMVEILSACLAVAALAFEASSFLDDKGPPPDVGQCLLAIDVSAASGGAFLDRMRTLLDAYAAEGAHVPGDRRLGNRARAAAGVPVAQHILAELRALAGEGG